MSTMNAQISNNRRLKKMTNIAWQNVPLRGRFVCLANDLLVFKKVIINPSKNTKGVATLVIPRGTVVYKSSDKGDDRNKCRAEQATVVKINPVDRGTFNLTMKEVQKAYSIHTFGYGTTDDKTSKVGQEFELTEGVFRFIYRPLTRVYPLKGFSFENDACESGIHFFTKLEQAIAY